MHPVTVLGGRRAVGGGPDQRVGELHPPTYLEQPSIHRRGHSGQVEAQGRSRPVEQHRIPQGLGCRRQDQQLRLGGEQAQAPDVALLDLAGQRLAAGQPEPTGEVCAVPGTRQLQQGQGVAVALADELVTHRGIQRAGHVFHQQRAGIAVTESADGQLGQPTRTSSPTPVRAAPTSAICSARRRRATNPRSWAEAWSSHWASSTTQTSGRSSATSARSVRVASPTRNRSGAGPVLRPNTVARASRWGTGSRSRWSSMGAELVEAGTGQLHLRLDAHRPGDLPAVDPAGQIAQQGGLAHAGLAAQDRDAALTGQHVGHVISNAGIGNDSVKALVFIGGFAPEAGESATDLAGRYEGGTPGETLAAVKLSDGGTDLYIKQDRYHAQFAADSSPGEAAVMAVTQRPILESALNELSGEPAWKTIPSWFLFGTEDKNIPAAAQRFMAERAGSRRTVNSRAGRMPSPSRRRPRSSSSSARRPPAVQRGSPALRN
jgi:hypothetical protein